MTITRLYQLIDKFKALCQRASPGPWEVNRPGVPCRPYIVATTCDRDIQRTIVAMGNPTGGQGWPAISDHFMSIDEIRANAELIAAAGSELNELLACAEDAANLINKLPATVDGIRVIPGMLLYFYDKLSISVNKVDSINEAGEAITKYIGTVFPNGKMDLTRCYAGYATCVAAARAEHPGWSV